MHPQGSPATLQPNATTTSVSIEMPASTSSKIPGSEAGPSNQTPPTTSYGHDRQPSVQLKIHAAGGPPLQAKTLKNRTIYWSCECVSSLRTQLVYFISHLSPIVQSITFLLVLLYLLLFFGDVTRDFFALAPGEIISPSQWYHTIIALWTHCFLETSWFMILIDLLVLSFCGTLIEPLWGYKEVLRFMCITCLPSGVLTCLHYVLLYSLTFNDSFLFQVRIHGLAPFCAALSVSVKQLLPQSVLLTTSVGRLKSDHVPFTVLVSVVIGYLVNVFSGSQTIMFVYGLLTSWLYLRFYQPHTRHTISSTSLPARTTTITRGDLSDSFAFETFFPNVLRPLVAVFSSTVYNVFVRCGLCPKVPSAAARLLNESNQSVYFQAGPKSTNASSFRYSQLDNHSQQQVDSGESS